MLDIVGLRRRGFEPEEVLRMYAVPLTLAQVHAALAYYYDHPEEIEASIREGRKLVARVRRDQAPFAYPIRFVTPPGTRAQRRERFKRTRPRGGRR